MKAYRIIAYKDGSHIEMKIMAKDDKDALDKFSEKVDLGLGNVSEDGFTGNKRIHITYEELNESEKNRAVETTSTT